MEQKSTARERLALFENRFFRGVSLLEAALMKTEEERRPFVLAQVERLLKEKMGGVSMAMHLSDALWYIDEGRTILPPYELLLPKWALEVYTYEERARLALILDISALCHDLSYHYACYLNGSFGIEGEFCISNKKLVDWLSTTKYEHIAMHTAYTLKKVANSEYFNMNYLAAQDETARIVSTTGNWIREPERTEIPPRDYVKSILDTLAKIERHWQRGRRLKLHPEVVMLHDEIWGFIPSRFDKDVLKAAQVLYDYMDKNVRGQMKHKGYKVSQWDEMPEGMQRKITDTSNAFFEKVCEVREKYLGEGWLTDQSLEINYLFTHAERIGGYWDND